LLIQRYLGGIGSKDMLDAIKSDLSSVSADSYINLPVGYNLYDHVGTDVEITHPDVQKYDFYAAYNNPPSGDKQSYLSE
jgi:cellobiose dehydrogenase (acceptor)